MADDRTREASDDLIVRTREAHAAIKDLKAAIRETKVVIKEAEEARQQLASMLAEVVTDGISIAVEAGLENYSESIENAIEDAVQAVYKRFDAILAILLGETNDVEDAARTVRLYLDKGEKTERTERKFTAMVESLDRRLKGL